MRRANPPQKGSLLQRGFWSAAIALLSPLKQVYCGSFMSRRYRTQQKTLPIVAVTKNAAIDLMYSGEPKTLRNRRHIAAVFAPATIGPLQLLVFLVVSLTNLLYWTYWANILFLLGLSYNLWPYNLNKDYLTNIKILKNLS